MPVLLSNHALAAALKAEGLLPDNCRLVELLIPVSGPVLLRYETYVDTADLPKVARALCAAVPTPPPAVADEVRLMSEIRPPRADEDDTDG